MGGFSNVAEITDAAGTFGKFYAGWRKVPAVATVAGAWLDYSMSPGNPAPQYYAATPLAAKKLTQTDDGGIPHGGAVSPSTKYLRKMMAMCVSANGVPQRLYLLDYLLYYPFIDMGLATPQAMTNAQALTRYTDGEGVQMMAVLVAPHGLSGDTFTVTYTNQDGVAGRVTPLFTMTTSVAVNGTILTTQNGAGLGRGVFLTLQQGDTGVRSIESVTCTSGIDVGLFTMVLVRPLACFTVRGIDAPTEVDFLLNQAQMPVIVDDAYLNLITCDSTGSLSGLTLMGDITVIWD